MKTPKLPDLLRLARSGESFITVEKDRRVTTVAYRLAVPRRVATTNIRIIFPGSLDLEPAVLVTMLD